MCQNSRLLVFRGAKGNSFAAITDSFGIKGHLYLISK
jgi:hypothetical protein